MSIMRRRWFQGIENNKYDTAMSQKKIQLTILIE